jgi:hypothetical protein
MFKETMYMGQGEPQGENSPGNPLDQKILDVNTKITKAQDFIASLEKLQEAEPTDRRKKDILGAKIDLAEFQTEKQHLLDEKFSNIPHDLGKAANDSIIDPVMEGTSERYDSDRMDYRDQKAA